MPAAVRTADAFSNALRELRRMLSLSATFQAQLGLQAGDTAGALQRIFIHREPVPMTEDQLSPGTGGMIDFRPIALILPTPNINYPVFAGGSQNWHHPSGELALLLEDNDRYPDDPTSSALEFAGFVGGVITDLVELSGVDDHLPLGAVHALSPPTDLDPEERAAAANYWYMLFGIPWGDQSGGGGQ